MRYFLFIIALIIFSIFTGWIMFSDKEDPYLSQEEKLVNDILGRTAKIIKKKYGVNPSGEGAAMPDGIISQLTLTFDTSNQLSQETLRKLLVECAQELVAQAKLTNVEKFLENPPFEIKNVQIIIYNNDKYGRDLKDPEISTAEISNGLLIYRTKDPDDNFKIKNQFKETYNEAIEILQRQPES